MRSISLAVVLTLVAYTTLGFIYNKTVSLETNMLSIDAVFNDRLVFTTSQNQAKELLLPQYVVGKAVTLDTTSPAYAFSDSTLSYYYKTPGVPNQVSVQPGSPFVAKLQTRFPVTQSLLDPVNSRLYAFASDSQSTPYEPYGVLYVYDSKTYAPIAQIDLTDYQSLSSIKDVSDKWQSLDLNDDGSLLLLVQGGINIFALDTKTLKITQHQTLATPTSTARFSVTVNSTTYLAICGGSAVSLYVQNVTKGPFVSKRTINISAESTALECSVAPDLKSYFSVEFNKTDKTLQVVKRDMLTLVNTSAIKYNAMASINLTRPHYQAYSNDEGQLALVVDEGVKIIDLVTFQEKGHIDSGSILSSVVFSTTNTQLAIVDKTASMVSILDSVSYALLYKYPLPEEFNQILVDDSAALIYINTPLYLSVQKLEEQTTKSYVLEPVSDVKAVGVINKGNTLVVAGSFLDGHSGSILVHNLILNKTDGDFPIDKVPIHMVVSNSEKMVAVELDGQIRVISLADGETVASINITGALNKFLFLNKDDGLAYSIKGQTVVSYYTISKNIRSTINFENAKDFAGAPTSDLLIVANRSLVTLLNTTTLKQIESLSCQDKFDQISLIAFAGSMPAVFSWNNVTQTVTIWKDYNCPQGEYNLNGVCTCNYGSHRDQQNHCVCDDFRQYVSGFCQCNQHFVDSNGTCVCEAGRYYDGTGCVCQANRYLAPNGTCLCKETWVEVGSQCVCAATRVLRNDSCVCEDGREQKLGECVCKTNRTLYNNYCVCEYGRFEVAGDCLCDTNRRDSNGTCVCNNGKVDDTTGGCVCKPDQVFKDGKCQCQYGYYLDGQNCQQCSAICSDCSGGASSCTTTNPLFIATLVVGGVLLIVCILLVVALIRKSRQSKKSKSLLQSIQDD